MGKTRSLWLVRWAGKSAEARLQVILVCRATSAGNKLPANPSSSRPASLCPARPSPAQPRRRGVAHLQKHTCTSRAQSRAKARLGEYVAESTSLAAKSHPEAWPTRRGHRLRRAMKDCESHTLRHHCVSPTRSLVTWHSNKNVGRNNLRASHRRRLLPRGVSVVVIQCDAGHLPMMTMTWPCYANPHPPPPGQSR